MPFLEITEEVWDRTMEVSLKEYFLCSQRAAKEMVKQKSGGRIVSISSIHAVRVWETDTAYGLEGGSDSLDNAVSLIPRIST
jgi:NAD(P)-dependent dehydrogenase (short-subunit alcohol dehydrogenase family)